MINLWKLWIYGTNCTSFLVQVQIVSWVHVIHLGKISYNHRHQFMNSSLTFLVFLHPWFSNIWFDEGKSSKAFRMQEIYNVLFSVHFIFTEYTFQTRWLLIIDFIPKQTSNIGNTIPTLCCYVCFFFFIVLELLRR